MTVVNTNNLPVRQARTPRPRRRFTSNVFFHDSAANPIVP